MTNEEATPGQSPEDAKKQAEEEEIVSGLLRFRVNGREVPVPELKWRASRVWQQTYIATHVRLSQPDSPDALSEEGQLAIEDAQLELVLAYDQTHALGDLENATRREISAIYDRILEVAFPLADSQTTLLVAIVRRAVDEAHAKAEQSRQESSTSGPSPTGVSAAPTILKGHSRTARSSSSTRRRRSA
jgi:hypothetical protein